MDHDGNIEIGRKLVAGRTSGGTQKAVERGQRVGVTSGCAGEIEIVQPAELQFGLVAGVKSTLWVVLTPFDDTIVMAKRSRSRRNIVRAEPAMPVRDDDT